MKIIKLGSNAVAGKDYTLEIPVVVRPAIIRYVSRNLKDLAKTNPDLAIVYTDEQYDKLPASIKNKLENPETGLLTSGAVELEFAVNPAEEFAGDVPSDSLVEELFMSTLDNGLSDLTDYIGADGMGSIELTNKIIVAAGYGSTVYPNYSAVYIPVKWFINNKEDIAEMASPLEDDETGVTSTEVASNSVTIKKKLNKSSGSSELIGYQLLFDDVEQDTSFLLTAIIDMNGAEFFEDSGDLTNGTVIESPLFKDWKKTFNFEVIIHAPTQQEGDGQPEGSGQQEG